MSFLRTEAKELRDRIYGPALIVRSNSATETLVSTESGSVGVVEVPWLARAEIVERVRELNPFVVTPFSLYQKDLVLYVNVLHEFQTLDTAFAAAGIQYVNPSFECWQLMVIDFLGILFDTEIAKIIGRSHQSVNMYRKGMGIPSASEFQRQLKGEESINPELVDRIKERNRARLAQYRDAQRRTVFTDVRAQVRELIVENHKKKDRELVAVLAAAGIKMAHRTVNKYRNELVRQGLL